jgi:hypothetical protein
MQLGRASPPGSTTSSGARSPSPDTAGGVEFVFDGAGEQLVVTSRLYSTAPTPTVGMFIPGTRRLAGVLAVVLTSVRNGGPGEGFRTNVGVFTPGIASVSVAFRSSSGRAAGRAVVRTVGPHSGVQVNAIFTAAGVGDLPTSNAVVAVDATGPGLLLRRRDRQRHDGPVPRRRRARPRRRPHADAHGGTPTSPPSPTLTPTATADADRDGHAADRDPDRLADPDRDPHDDAERHAGPADGRRSRPR